MSSHPAKKHLPETAGHLMVQNVPTVSEQATIADVEKLLLNQTKKFETIDYIYVIDQHGRLKGVISPKEIFRSHKRTAVKSLMQKKIIFTHLHSDQEHVAMLALKNKIKAIPVIDKDKKFIGVIPSDKIFQILHSEGVENMLRFAGLPKHQTHDDIFKLSAFTLLKHRLPWLMLGLIGGILAAAVTGLFEKVLAENLILAAFIPLIVYMADAVGTQMEAFIIRDLTINPKLKFIKYFFRQALIVTMIGFVASALIYGASLFIYDNFQLSLVLSLTLFLAVFSSLATGLVVPYVFGRLNFDPANASGPIATIIQDVLSVLIYFYIASLLLT